MTHEIDATNQTLGRLASQIALILRGKTHPDFQPNQMPNDKVIVSNIKKIKFTGKKLTQKMYYHYSGYPGGLKAMKLKTIFGKNPGRVLRGTVYRMLAQNRLRDKIIKNLTVK